MKLFNKFFVVLVLIIVSCVEDDSNEDLYFENLPIESISFPNEFELNEVYEIDFTFLRPTSCHGYYDIVMEAENESRTINVKSLVYKSETCSELAEDNSSEQSFIFNVIYNQTYVFHVWKGVDANGDDIYEDYQVPVVN